MHEASLIDSLLRLARRELRAVSASRVTAVHLRVGALSGALPDALLFAFEAAREGVFAGAELVIEPDPAAAHCLACDEGYRPEGFPFVCPHCGSEEFRLTGGRDVYLDFLEYEG